MTETDSQIAARHTAFTLAEALPYIQRYAGQTIVVKFGGHAMVDEALSDSFARDVVLLKHLGVNPVIVHGGGPQIGKLLERLGIVSKFEDGLRVTDDATMEVVEMVLSGAVNKTIVRAINKAGGQAVGLSGSDANLIRARKAEHRRSGTDSQIEKIIDLGLVGEPDGVNPELLNLLSDEKASFIPVVAPVGVSDAGERYNINADSAAGAIAAALQARRLLLLTDVAGVLDKEKAVVKSIAHNDIKGLIDDGTVVGGMIPKLETAAKAVRDGVGATVILDGRAPHALLMELFTEHGAGTLIS